MNNFFYGKYFMYILYRVQFEYRIYDIHIDVPCIYFFQMFIDGIGVVCIENKR